MDKFKQALRQTYLQTRKKLSLQYINSASQKICDAIGKLEFYRHSKFIVLYQAQNGEVDLQALWKTAPLHGKYCYFPAVQPEGNLIFLPATPKTKFQKNQYGIAEPNVARNLARPPDALDIIFVPLVSFDTRCNRVGMGKGYYDKTLEYNNRPLLIGVAYEFQNHGLIAPESWDVPLDMIITPNQIFHNPE